MNEHVFQTVMHLCNVVRTVPVGTNLALLHLLWMMISGHLLPSRGAIIPGLHQMGLSDKAVRRAWQALRRGSWTIGQLIVNGRLIAATPPDRSETWEENGVTVRADIWDNLILRGTKAEEAAEAPTFSIVVIHHPLFAHPLVLATSLSIAARHIYHLYLDRWPVEQVPLAAKQMIGAHRAFVFAEETCQRLPELALLAGAILSYLAAILPAVPTGFWDRVPKPTPGRLRRFLGCSGFPINFPLPPEIRQKASVTDHLPKGSSLFRRKRRSVATT